MFIYVFATLDTFVVDDNNIIWLNARFINICVSSIVKFTLLFISFQTGVSKRDVRCFLLSCVW